VDHTRKAAGDDRNSIKFKEPGLVGGGIDPQFAIGHRALFLLTPFRHADPTGLDDPDPVAEPEDEEYVENEWQKFQGIIP
jgi:hypothetical protein